MKSTRFSLRVRHRVLLAGMLASVAMVGGVAAAAANGAVNPFGTNQVNSQASGRILLPDNQWITPYGQRAKLQAVSLGAAISPDGTKIAAQTSNVTTGTDTHTEMLQILNAADGQTLQSVQIWGSAAPVYSPDGKSLYVSTDATNAIVKYTVDPSSGLITNPTSPQTVALAAQARPAGLTISSDGATLYAALNGSNNLAIVDTATMQVSATIPVGNVPQNVVIVGDEAFVTNRGGRLPEGDEYTKTSDNQTIVANPKTGASTTGTVSVVDLRTHTVTDTVTVGLQPTAMTVHNGLVFVTNTDSDTVSIIDAKSHSVTQTINVEPLPGSTVGASPTSVAFPDSYHMLVSAGGDNAIVEYAYDGPKFPVKYQGLIPTDWYPNQVSYDAKLGRVLVNNQQGYGTVDHTSYTTTGSVTSFKLPTNNTLGTLTRQVFQNNGWDNLPPASENNKATVKGGGVPVPIPQQLGQPSAIKHVFLIIKENQSYDQVLGDIGKGDSDPTEGGTVGQVAGAQVTPNEHNLANTFTLFDNFYDPSTVSPDGHNWIDQATNNDYMRYDQATGWQRSYPSYGPDSLTFQTSGEIWNTVLAAGKSVRDYGEMCYDQSGGTVGTWQQYYADSQIMEGKATGPLPIATNTFYTGSDVPALNSICEHVWAQGVGAPDQYRVDLWTQDFQQQLKTNTVPDFTILYLPSDHTYGVPSAQAMIADNDLGVGRVVDTISHSKVWKNSAIFALEDDTANGYDHVDGHRAPLWIASPYAKRGVINNSYYTQVNVDKTIEQILGAQPMNQMDRAAVPMYDAFTNKPNYTPYNAVPNNIPLTQGVTGLVPLTPAADSTPAEAKELAATNGPAVPAAPAAEQSVAAAWADWEKTAAAVTKKQGVDMVNPPQSVRYQWYTATNWSKPYPGDKTILTPDQVPGRNISELSGDN